MLYFKLFIFRRILKLLIESYDITITSYDIVVFNTFSGYDECGIYNMPTALNENENTDQIEHSLDPVGIVQQIKYPVCIEQQIIDPKYEEFSSFDARMKSFYICKIKLKKSIVDLSEAGLFYTGT